MLSTVQDNPLNAESPGRSLGISRNTVKRYQNFLEGAFMVCVLNRWFANLGKRLVKSPIVYIRDSGLLHNLLGLTSYESLFKHIQLGVTREGFIIEELAANPNEKLQL